MPNALLDRLRGTTDEAAEALAATLEIVTWLTDHVQGLQITALHGSAAMAERLLGAINQRLSPARTGRA